MKRWFLFVRCKMGCYILILTFLLIPQISVSAEQDKICLSVLYFENTTGDSETDWMSKGLTDLLINSLQKFTFINVVEREEVEKVLKEIAFSLGGFTEGEIETGKLLKADYQVTGSFISSGGAVKVYVKITEVKTSKILKTRDFSMTKDVFQLKVDEMTEGIAEDLSQISLFQGKKLVKPKVNSRRIMTTDSFDATAHFYRGLDYGDKKKHGLAIQEYESAIGIDENFVRAYVNLGVAYFENGQETSAVEYLNKAIELSPDLALPYYNLGMAYQRLRNLDEAIINFEKVISLEPNNKNAYINLGVCYYQKGEVNSAISSYQKAIEIDTYDKTAYFNLGTAYFKLKEYNQAITAWEKAVEIDFEFAEAYIKLGNAYETQDMFLEAVKYYELALRYVDESKKGEIYKHIGLCAGKGGEVEKAVSNLEKTSRYLPYDIEVWYSLGVAYVKMKDYDSATSAFEKVANIDPDGALGLKAKEILRKLRGE